MQSATILLVEVLLCLQLLSMCVGAPPHKDGQNSSPKVPIRFTEEEQKFLMDTICNLPEDYHHSEVPGTSLWIDLAKQLEELRKIDRPGLPSVEKLPHRIRAFCKKKLLDNPELMKALPKSLKDHFLDPNHWSKKYTPVQGHRPRYSLEEHDLIAKELLKSSEIPKWVRIQKIHTQNHNNNIPGFGTVRSAKQLQQYFERQRKLGHWPEDIMNKFPSKKQSGESSSKSNDGEFPSESQEENFEIPLDERDENDWDGSALKVPNRQYTKVEDNFIMNELRRILREDPGRLRKLVWEEIAMLHQEKRNSNTRGFLWDRTATSIYYHFRDKKRKSKNSRAPLPNRMSTRFPDPSFKTTGASSSKSTMDEYASQDLQIDPEMCKAEQEENDWKGLDKIDESDWVSWIDEMGNEPPPN